MSSLDAFIPVQSVVTAYDDHVPTNTRNNDLVHQYEEEEEEEDKIENAPDHVSIKLAERTSSLINSFNEYIADLSDRDEDMMLGSSNNCRNIDWSERTQDIGIVKLDWSERTDDMVDRMNDDWSDRSGLSGMSGGLSDSIIERMSHIPGSDSYKVSPTRRVPPLLRDWNDPNTTASNLSALAMKHKFNAYNEDDSSYEEKMYHYTNINYKRVKRLGVVGVIVLIVALIAIIIPSSNRRRSSNTTTTPSALRKEEEKTELVLLFLEQEQNDQEEVEDKVTITKEVNNPETEDNVEGKESAASTIDDEEEVVQSLYASAFSGLEEDFDITSGLVQEMKESFNPVTRPGPEYFIEEEEAESLTPTVESNVDGTILLVHNQFKPVWLSSKEDWNGGSHDDAVALCSLFREPKQLCPYSVICPHGPGGAVMGGLHQMELIIEGEQYAPVMGGKNHWVMIGNTDGTMIESKDENMSTCQTHRQIHGKNPDWGINGDRRELKQYIMCCTVDTM